MRISRLTVDGVIISDGKLLLIRRGNPPFKDAWALPGGFVDYGETVEAAVRREVKEETGLTTSIQQLVGVYSDPHRDPRGHTVSVVFLLAVESGTPEGGDDAVEAGWFSLDELPELAFDHAKIINDALALHHGMQTG
ncbi:MAG: NUDIX domain-containing protein [Thermoplasmatota archaeon]